ncbi:MAG: hypothetical protein D6713_07690 [Deltaproteobacteria bacterium]|nr:MAG: hypothetical protein D6713_07690 [Deltaproteobacteria bacterium]
MKVRVALSSLSLGFVALVSQVILLREIYAVTGGSEIVYGLALGAWLASGGAGAFLAEKFREAVPGRGVLLSLIPLTAFVSLLLLRLSRRISGILPGEFPPFLFTAGVSILGPFLPSFVGGCLFSRLASDGREVVSPGTIFSLEALGAFSGGLVSVTGPFVSSPHATALLMTAGASLFLAGISSARGKGAKALFLLLSLVIAGAAVPAGRAVEVKSVAQEYPGFALEETAQCERGRLDVISRQGERFFFFNSERIFATGDLLAVEEKVHLPASFLPGTPTTVFFGASGVFLSPEAAKYGVGQPLVVSGDRTLTRHLMKWGGKARVAAGDPLSTGPPEGERFSLGILTLSSPVSLASTRFLTGRFFEAASRFLDDGGLLCLVFPFGGEYISGEEREILRWTVERGSERFPHWLAVPGEEVFLLFSSSQDLFAARPEEVAARFSRRDPGTRFLRPPLFLFRLDPERVAWLRGEITPSRQGSPFPFGPALRDEYRKGRGNLDRAVASLLSLPKGAGAVLILAAFLVVSALLPGERRFRGGNFTLYVAGLLGMYVEVFVIFAYQVTWGSVYSRVGLLFCSYMLGLSIGSWMGGERRGKVLFSLGILSSFALCVLPFLSSTSAPPAFLFMVALFLTGKGGGALYAAASRESPAGALYASDLLGASAASLAAPISCALLGPYLGALLPLPLLLLVVFSGLG